MPEARLSEGPEGPALENGALRLSVRLDEGTFAIATADGDVAIAEAWTGAVFADGGTLTSRGAAFEMAGAEIVEDAQGRGRALSLRRRAAAGEPGLSLTLTLYEERPFAALQSRLTNSTGGPLRAQAFHVLHGSLPAGRQRFYKHGWQSWSPTLVLDGDEDDLPPFAPVIDATASRREGALVSDLVASLYGEGGRTLTAGFVSTAEQLSQVWLAGDRLTAASFADGIEIAPGGELRSERVVVDITSDPVAALRGYGDALAREMGAVSWPHAPSGWCSWYQYFERVSEADIVANLEWLAAHREELPLEYVQIDDGYQAGIGDWLTVNEKFPGGMAWLAERIHEAGFKAGLWLAPFLVGANSRLFAERPQWLVRNATGGPAVAIQNWGQLCYALDCTRPDVIEWLEGVFRTVTEAWGYDYVKIDFVYAAAMEGVRHDANVTRAQAYRRGLEAIRRAVGERFVLGCGAPLGPSVGLVNGMRIGPDVAPAWYPALRGGRRTGLSLPSTVNSIRNTITRFWTHERLWQSDPDCLMVRGTETQLTEGEVRTLATVIAMSGGMLLASDDLTKLTPELIEMLARLLPLRGEAAVPLDLGEGEMPRLLWRQSDGLLAAFNWSDEAADVVARLPRPSRRVRDFWSGEELPVEGNELRLRGVPAHGCRLLVLSG
jgi:alpha-galactosidase